jgi:DNA polymerase III epsilon subunit-like protein
MSYNYIGLDLETSGTTHERHVPIQIGVALRSGEVFNSLIGQWGFPWGQYDWDEEAFAVHGITKNELLDAPEYGEVDTVLSEWLEEHAGPGTKIMVGWNVGAFDRPFVDRWLPKTAAMFIRRTLDLNAACYLMELKGVRNPDTLKRQAKAYADDCLTERGATEGRHDAAYDAQCALYELEYLRRML